MLDSVNTFSCSLLTYVIIGATFPLSSHAKETGTIASRVDRGELTPVEYTAKWCGARALWMLLVAFDSDELEFEDVLAQCESTPEQNAKGELSLLQLVHAAKNYGYVAQGFSVDSVTKLDRPCLTVHRIRSRDDNTPADQIDLHVRIFLRADNEFVYYIDPFRPRRLIRSPIPYFEQSWTSHCLIVQAGSIEFSGANEVNILLGLCLITLACLLLFLTLPRPSVLILSFSIFALSLLSGCNSQQSDRVSRTSAIEFDDLDIRRSEAVPTGEFVTENFKFVNIGSVPIRISHIDKSCSCTVEDYSNAEVMPGESSSLSVTVNGDGIVGEYTTRVIVHFDEKREEGQLDWTPNGEIALSCGFTFLPKVSIVPRRLDFQRAFVRESEEKLLQAVYRCPRESNGTLSFDTKSKFFQTRIISAERKSHESYDEWIYQIGVEFCGKTAGTPERDTINILDNRGKTIEIVTVFGRSKSRMFEVEPASLAVANDTGTVVVKVSSVDMPDENEGFKFRVEDPTINCVVSPLENGEFKLSFSVTKEPERRIVNSNLVVSMNGEMQESVFVPLVLVNPRTSN